MRAILRPVAGILREHDHQIRLAWRGLRQRLFVARVRLLAKAQSSSVTIRLAPDVRIGRGISVTVWPGTHTSIELGPRSVIDDHVVLHLKGGELRGGEQTELRPGSALHIGGTLTLEGDNRISYGCVLHCAESIRLERAAIVGEHSGIADSTHFHSGPDDPIMHNVATAPVLIGRNTFICPRASIGRGVTIGPWSIVGPGSVVSRDVPAGAFASGMPAVVVRDLQHPWLTAGSNRDAVELEPSGPPDVTL